MYLLSNVGEVLPMWIIFSLFLVLLLLGIEFYVPPVVLLLFFLGVIASAVVALIPLPTNKQSVR